MTTLYELLADPSRRLEAIVEIDGVHRSTGDAIVLRASTRGRASDSVSIAAGLVNPGSIARELVDPLISGAGRTGVGQIEIENLPTTRDGVGRHDDMTDYRFAGEEARILVGEASVSLAEFHLLATATVRGEPLWSGSRIRVQLQPMLDRLLERRLERARLVGIRTAPQFIPSVNGTRASCSSINDYVTPTLTLGARFRYPAGSSDMTILDRGELSGTVDRHFFLRINGANGALDLRVVSGGAVKAPMGTTDLRDDRWHVGVVTVALDVIRVYVDMALEAELLLTSPITVADVSYDLRWGWNAVDGAQLCDTRFFTRALDPSEVRSIFAARGEGDEPGCVGYWMADDGAGNTIADSSPNANDLTLLGIEDSAYSWSPTDLGEPDQAGRAMPITYGLVAHAGALLVDQARRRYRWSDRSAETAALRPLLRSRGIKLGESVDWSDEGDGVVELVSGEEEPVSFETAMSTLAPWPTLYLDRLIERIATERAGLEAGDLNANALDALAATAPWASGWHSQEETTAAVALGEVIGGAGGYYYEGRNGKLVAGLLMPPVAPSPLGPDAIEFLGWPSSQVAFDGSVGRRPTAGSWSVLAWVKPFRLDADPVSTGSVVNHPDIQVIGRVVGQWALGICLASDSSLGLVPGQVLYYTEGIENGGGAEFTVSPTPLPWGEWSFVVGVYDASGGTRKLLVGSVGGALVEVSSESVSGTLATPASGALELGGSGSGSVYVGGMRQVATWTIAQTPAAAAQWMVEDIAEQASWPSGLQEVVPLIDREPSTTAAAVGPSVSASGTVTGARWAPRVHLDLDDLGLDLRWRDLVPTSFAEVGYARNYYPLSGQDISSAVPASDAPVLRRSAAVVPVVSGTDSEQTRQVAVLSPVIARADAMRLARLVAARLEDGRRQGELDGLGHDRGRGALALSMTDEVMLYWSRYGMETGRSFRVLSTQLDLDRFIGTLGLWG